MPQQQQLAAEFAAGSVSDAGATAGSLQQAIGGALPGSGNQGSHSGGSSAPNGGGSGQGGAGLSGLDEVGARMAQFQLAEQFAAGAVCWEAECSSRLFSQLLSSRPPC